MIFEKFKMQFCFLFFLSQDSQKIQSNLQINMAKFDQDPTLKEFGITIGGRDRTKLLEVEAATLLAPRVLYKDVSCML